MVPLCGDCFGHSAVLSLASPIGNHCTTRLMIIFFPCLLIRVIPRLLALTYFLAHCLSFRSGNIATYMISTSSFLPSFKSYISLGPSFRIFVGIFALAEKLPTSANFVWADGHILDKQMNGLRNYYVDYRNNFFYY